MPSATSTKPHVLILGAGLGGLCLAQALRKQSISYEIFERDAGLHARFQGWAIALHFVVDDLLASIPDDMPPIEMADHLRQLGLRPGMKMYAGGRVNSIESKGNRDLLRCNRSRLRDWLATNLQIQWDKHMTRIEETEDNVKLHFSDGTTATGDILVGADGVHSPVRHHLLDGKDQLNTLPLGLIVGEPTLNKVQYERQLELGHSAYIGISKSGTNRLFVGLNSVAEDCESAKYYWILSWDDPAAAHEPYWTIKATKQELFDHAFKEAKQFSPELTEVMRMTTVDQISTPPLVIRDMVLKELPNRRITLLGDAAHPMTPFRGEGGNNALQDALNLARALGKSDSESLQANLKEYQTEMLLRGSMAVEKSRQATKDTGELTQQAWSQWRKE